MLEANINTNIEITDIEMFTLLGQKTIEIFMKDKTIEKLLSQIDKVKTLIIELETVKKTNSELDTSNKSLSEMNIKLDMALTDERHKLKDAIDKCEQLNIELGGLKNVKYNKSKKGSNRKSTNS